MRTFITSILLLLAVVALSQSVYSPQLTSLLNDEKSAEYAEINIFFDNQESLEDLAVYLDDINADFDTRVKEVTDLLKRNSELSVEMFLQDLDDKKLYLNNNIKRFETYWGVNMVNMEVKTSVIPSIASFENVRYVDLNTPRYRMEDNGHPVILSDKAVDEAEPGLKTINAHLLWELGYTGRNLLFLSVDTGVNPDHPAIEDRFAGNYLPMDQCWYGVRHDLPVDNALSSHGTHTTGTVLGLDRTTNDTIGVAFNSVWLATDPVASSQEDLLAPADLLSVFEWALNPDGNPETTDDVPRVINNSWGFDYEMAMLFGACEMVEAEILVSIETAGICCPFSAGNSGPAASTIGFPAMRAFNLVNPMSVGALNPDETTIASFSSIGPSLCVPESGSLQIKPEVSAPGVAVRSCVGINEYGELSGTSMACPHVSGALLLLAEAFPNVSAYDLKNSLYVTAVDLGEPGEDNVYGNGRIDVFAAYEYLALTNTPTPPVSNQYDLECEIVSPENNLFCSDEQSFVPQILISNDGTQNIDQIIVHVYLNDELIIDSLLDVEIEAGGNFNFVASNFEFIPGENYVHALVKSQAEYVEYDRFNNADIQTYYVIQEDEFPYSTDFNGFADLNWYINNPDNLIGWENLSWGTESQNSALGIRFGDYSTREWETDYANLPIIGLPDQENIFFNFTYAYKKRVEFIFKDSVIVELSTDCGDTFPYELWRNGGEAMATVEGNAFEELFVPQTDQDFDTISLSLSEFRNQDVIIRFSSKNDRGSAMYLDFVEINENQISIHNNDIADDKVKVYPNPALDYFVIEVSDLDLCNSVVEMYNSSGQKVIEEVLTSKNNIISVESLKPGIYIVRIKNSQFNHIIIIE